MDIQKQIAFEKFHAKECNCDYNELKRRLDHQEKVMGHRYIPSSPRHEAWLVWDAAWQAKAQAVPEGFVLVPKKPDVDKAWDIALKRIVPPPKTNDAIQQELMCKKYVDNLCSEQDRILLDYEAMIEVQEQSHD